MTAVEKVLDLCQDRKIPISRLERECQFSNGYLKGLRNGKIPADRVRVIGDYLNVPYSEIDPAVFPPQEDHYYLNDDARELAEFLFHNPEYKVLFDASRKVKKEDIAFVKEMIERTT